jgi:hypothetical protein
MIRLLQYNNEGDFSLTTFLADNIPRKYAILSHTWGTEEVTFGDLQNRTGIKKAGYEKIRFCGEQARRDGLEYFWVDTCCINKSSSAELTEAIISYGEGKEKALKRLREQTGAEVKRGDFSVSFNLSGVPKIESFVAREEELAEMHRRLKSDGSRRTVVLHGLAESARHS